LGSEKAPAQLATPPGSGSARFVVSGGAGSLVSLLFVALLKSRWPDAECELKQSNLDNALVEISDAVTGRRLLIYNVRPDALELKNALANGRTAFLTLAASALEVEAAVSIFESQSVLPSPGFIPAADLRLTPRESDVAALIAEGLNNAEIARQLNISVHTVRSHLESISARLGVKSRGKLAARIREANGTRPPLPAEDSA
jgi:DNA-binding NarL/FixJ family response regulator